MSGMSGMIDFIVHDTQANALKKLVGYDRMLELEMDLYYSKICDCKCVSHTCSKCVLYLLIIETIKRCICHNHREYDIFIAKHYS